MSQVKHDAELQEYEVVKRDLLAVSKWIKLETITYKLGPDDEERKWDVASRTTKRNNGSADAVTILALLSNGNGKHMEKDVLLVAQFRPPIENLSIELPAGLIDDGETAGQAALRELKEETGYTGTLRCVSPVLSQSPGMTDETTVVAIVDVDLTLPENLQPEQRLEDSEKIQATRVKLSDFASHLEKYGNDMIVKGIYFMALGLQLAAEQDIVSTSTGGVEHDKDLQQYQILKRDLIKESKWLKLETITYKLGPNERERKWDMATRTGTVGSGTCSAVNILALLSNGQCKNADKEILLVTQFRPPIGKLSIELPAGILDPGETPAEAALRELKEETGYTGVVRSVSPKVASSPGLTDEASHCVVVEVDLGLTENQNPQQDLQGGEMIDVTRVKICDLLKHLKQYEQDALSKTIYFLALGLQLASEQPLD